MLNTCFSIFVIGNLKILETAMKWKQAALAAANQNSTSSSSSVLNQDVLDEENDGHFTKKHKSEEIDIDDI